jgi:aryl-alcohol dehydrogenase-like predicted oxidoreductase
MKARKLRQDGLTVSEIGLGCMSLTGIYGAPRPGPRVSPRCAPPMTWA